MKYALIALALLTSTATAEEQPVIKWQPYSDSLSEQAKRERIQKAAAYAMAYLAAPGVAKKRGFLVGGILLADHELSAPRRCTSLSSAARAIRKRRTFRRGVRATRSSHARRVVRRGRGKITEPGRRISATRSSRGFRLHRSPLLRSDFRSRKDLSIRQTKEMRRGLALALAVIGLSVSSIAHAQETLQIGGSKIEVAFGSPPTAIQRKLVLEWVSAAACAVTAYYEQFPVAHVLIRVRFFEGRGVRSGQTFGWNGALITIAVGQSSTPADFARDWMMTHEMVHLAFPSVAERHHWIEEGLSTYIEPLARVRVGSLTPEKAWSDLVDGLPQGLPESSDRGLDFTPTWGRTYWGGALFCLLADIEIRKRTGNKKGLDHALRAILNAGGTIQSDWELTRALEIGDRAIGAPILSELYDKMKSEPAPVDLNALWKQLGIRRQNRRTEFDDTAPLAPIRRAMMH